MNTNIKGTIIKQNNTYYWNIVGGRFARRVLTDGAERVTKSGKTVMEAYVDGIEGHIVALYIQDTEYGPILRLKIKNDEVYHVINIPVNSSFFRQFVNKLPNVDLNKAVSVELAVYKGRNVLFVRQGDGNIKNALWEWNEGHFVKLDKNVPAPPDGWEKMPKIKQEEYMLKLKHFLIDVVERVATGLLPDWPEDNNSATEDLEISI